MKSANLFISAFQSADGSFQKLTSPLFRLNLNLKILLGGFSAECDLYKEVVEIQNSNEFKKLLDDPRASFHEFTVFLLMFKHVCEWVASIDTKESLQEATRHFTKEV